MSFLIGFMLRLALSSLQARISERMNKPCGGEKVQVGKDQEKTQSEKDSHSKNRGKSIIHGVCPEMTNNLVFSFCRDFV